MEKDEGLGQNGQIGVDDMEIDPVDEGRLLAKLI